MKKKTLLLALALIIVMIFSTLAGAGSAASFYKKLIKREKIGKIREYWNEKLTYEILRDRGDDIIVEKILGTVVNKKKDGKIMNPGDPNYDYISYKSVKGVKKGDTILTICIYQPGNSYEDDVTCRFDYIIDREKKKVKKAK